MFDDDHLLKWEFNAYGQSLSETHVHPLIKKLQSLNSKPFKTPDDWRTIRHLRKEIDDIQNTIPEHIEITVRRRLAACLHEWGCQDRCNWSYAPRDTEYCHRVYLEKADALIAQGFDTQAFFAMFEMYHQSRQQVKSLLEAADYVR